jgi:hypothetical protein
MGNARGATLMHNIKRILMSVAVAAAAVFAVAGGSALTPAFAGNAQQSAKADAEYKTADLGIQIRYRDDSRVCCKRGGRDWWSGYRQCRRSGGYVTNNRECRDGRVGYENQRVCCKRGHRDWWSTSRECRRSGGHTTTNRECRRD